MAQTDGGSLTHVEEGLRIPLVPDPLPERVLNDSIIRDGQPLLFFRVLAHHPRLQSRMSRLGGLVLQTGVVPARDREIAILRVAACTGCQYEFGQHATVGAKTGLSEDEIRAIGTQRTRPDGWSDEDWAIVDMTDQLLQDAEIVDDGVLDGLVARYGYDGLLELITAVGLYRIFASIMKTAGVPLEQGARRWEGLLGSGE
jgi:4-carboxymuconolactone decarboxylase